MEKVLAGLSSQDFLELYKLLVKSELLENCKTAISGSEFWERIATTQDLMISLNVDTENCTDEKDVLFPEPAEAPPCATIINTTPQSTVDFHNLQEIYEKVQSRAGGGSHQRVASGFINIRVISEGQICGINVFVQRLPEAATLCGDMNGQVPLQVNHEDYFQNQQLFSVDLDSVYNSPSGTPVYKLATVDAERRNLFNLVVFLRFIDGTQSGPFMSKPFLLRSRKPGSRANSFEFS